MRVQLVARRIILAPLVALAIAIAVAACSSSSTSSGSPSGSTSADAAQITANWEKFFASSTPTAQKVPLLQNGSTFAPAINGLFHLVPKLSSTVSGVTVNSPTSATVTYNLKASGTPLFPSDQTGKTVYENGVWKVSDATLCGLMKLVPGGSPPAACSSVS
jgi:hypothetical protein